MAKTSNRHDVDECIVDEERYPSKIEDIYDNNQEVYFNLCSLRDRLKDISSEFFGYEPMCVSGDSKSERPLTKLSKLQDQSERFREVTDDISVQIDRLREL